MQPPRRVGWGEDARGWKEPQLGHSLPLPRFPVHVDEQDEHHLQPDETRGAQRETHFFFGLQTLEAG